MGGRWFYPFKVYTIQEEEELEYDASFTTGKGRDEVVSRMSTTHGRSRMHAVTKSMTTQRLVVDA